MDYKKIQETILPAIKEAGKMLAQEFAKFDRGQMELKFKHDLITKFDLASESLILSVIKEHWPEHQILSEEAGVSGMSSDYLWILDPLDGTTNFTIHNPLFCISLALVYQKQVVMSIIYAPVLDELYTAIRGEGAFMNGQRIEIASQENSKAVHTFCHGSKQEDVKRAVQYYEHQKIEEFDCRQLGSAAIETVYVALGRVDSLVIPGFNLWDIAGGTLFAVEAGAVITDFQGQPWDLESHDFVVCSEKLLPEILAITKEI